MTMPGDNISIISNQFLSPNFDIAIALGASGYQGTFDNSNIVIAYNNFSSNSINVEVAGGISSTDPARVESVQVYGNTSTWFTQFLQTYDWSTNIHFYSNSVAIGTDFSDGKYLAHFISGAYSSQYALIDTNNLYYSTLYNFAASTNSISYANGSRYEIIYGYTAGSAYALSDTDSNQIPPGAQMLIQNDNTSSSNIPIYLNSACTGSPVIITNGTMQCFSWSGSQWTQDGYVEPRARVHW
jgi:hypothetical protein